MLEGKKKKEARMLEEEKKRGKKKEEKEKEKKKRGKKKKYLAVGKPKISARRSTKKTKEVVTNRWCFTYYFDEEEDVNEGTMIDMSNGSSSTIASVPEGRVGGTGYCMPDWIANNDRISFATCQVEACPTSGRFHLQGYLELTTRQKLSALKKINGTAHWEPANGDAESNIHYCNKQESRIDSTYPVIFTKGEFKPSRKGQGKRNDLLAAANLLKASRGDIRQVVDQFPTQFIRYARGLMNYGNYQKDTNKDRGPVKLDILWGPPGSGKSSWAAAHPEIYWFPKPVTSPFALGYTGKLRLYRSILRL